MDKLIEEKIGELLLNAKLTLATAESCTGGLIASRITDVAGSSNYFLGGAVVYSNQAKQKVLGVREETLLQFGAVSKQTVEEMAAGVAELYSVDVAISISGIMGPGGGSSEKPVGTTWICVLKDGAMTARKFLLTGSRVENKISAANAALKMMDEILQGD